MPKVWVQKISGPRCQLEITEDLPVFEVRRLVARELQLPGDRPRLVVNGQTLQDGGSMPRMSDGETILAFLAPALPSATFSRRAAGTAAAAADDADDDERFRILEPNTMLTQIPSRRLRHNATRFERAAARFLQNRLHVPDVVLSLLFSIKPQVLIGILFWFIGAPIAARFHLGPLYVLATILVLIFTNLGVRRAGEASAYSIFNEGLRALPGQLGTDQVDRAMRGQM